MDALSAVLDGPRGHDVFVLRIAMEPPWRLDVRDKAPLAILAVQRGSMWVSAATMTPTRLDPGDVLIARGPDTYTVAAAPDSEPHLEVYENERCVALDGRPVAEELTLGVRTWGNRLDGRDRLLLGTYLIDSDLSDRLLAALPPLAIVRGNEWDADMLTMFDREASRVEPGQSTILDRLVDLVLITTLRAWFTHHESIAPGWFTAHLDADVGRAVQLMHDHPAEAWTVGTLAREVGVSRATLSRRFTDIVGEAPMTYLTNWRLAMAADRLREPGATLAAVAPRVGYASPYALSAAFKRVRGVSPREHVRRHSVRTRDIEDVTT